MLEIDIAKMRAKRLKRVRNLANLTREQMCEESGINRHTLIGWENGRFGGLTLRGAEKIVARVKKEHVRCTVAWLMEGEGLEPLVNPTLVMSENAVINQSDELSIAQELAYFKSRNLNAVDLVVDDVGMLPYFQEGDVVAGKKRMDVDIEFTIGKDCIVETETGEKLLRNVREGKYRQTYTLICHNSAIKQRPSVISDVKLIYSAPVIWHRKKD